MDVLHHDLEAVERTSLGPHHLVREVHSKILVDDPIACCEECEHVLEEMLFIWLQFIPVLLVLVEIDFLRGPEAGGVFLVHLPDIIMLDGEENEAIERFPQHRFVRIEAHVGLLCKSGILLDDHLNYLPSDGILYLPWRGYIPSLHRGWKPSFRAPSHRPSTGRGVHGNRPDGSR